MLAAIHAGPPSENGEATSNHPCQGTRLSKSMKAVIVTCR